MSEPVRLYLQRNCPFYGFAMYRFAGYSGQPLPFVLMSSEGNQCALVTDKASPCVMETSGDAVEWHLCPRVEEVRIVRGHEKR